MNYNDIDTRYCLQIYKILLFYILCADYLCIHDLNIMLENTWIILIIDFLLTLERLV